MKYKYVVTAWKDGNEKKYVEAKTKSEANKIALKMMGGHYGFTTDAVDTCEVDEEGRLHSKTLYTLCGRTWIKTHCYIGEDE